MKRKRYDPQDQPPIPGLRKALADMLAEALITHTHRCVARVAAEQALSRAGVTEQEFFARWAAGDYDADL